MRLYALCCIYQKQCAFAGSKCTAYFITKINMTGSINQVQNILLPFPFIIDLDGMAFNGNAFFSFKVHIIQHLRLHIPFAYGMGKFQ